MNIDIIRLKNDINKEVNINLTYSFDKKMLAGTDVVKLDDVMIKGSITKNNLDEYLLNLTVHGEMLIPCAITLELVPYPFEVEIAHTLNEFSPESNEINQNIENTIDILPIIWENILVEIPMRVVSEQADNVELKGDGWQLKREDEASSQKLELEKLKDIIK